MALLDSASGKSLWRGMDYYKNNKVISVRKIDENTYSAIVKGNENNEYDVVLNLKHPKKSTCTCPFADGRNVICKHMVATYFTIFPDEEKRILREAEEYEQELDTRREEELKAIKNHVYSLKKAALREALLNYMIDEYDRRNYW